MLSDRNRTQGSAAVRDGDADGSLTHAGGAARDPERLLPGEPGQLSCTFYHNWCGTLDEGISVLAGNVSDRGHGRLPVPLHNVKKTFEKISKGQWLITMLRATELKFNFLVIPWSPNAVRRSFEGLNKYVNNPPPPRLFCFTGEYLPNV